MNSTIVSTGGRAISGSARSVAAPAIDHRKIRSGLEQGLLGLTQLAVLLLNRLHPPGHVARDARAPVAVDLGLLDPVVQRIRRATDLGGDRRDRLPSGTLQARSVENHPHCAFADFRENLFVVLLLVLHPTQELEPSKIPCGSKTSAVNGRSAPRTKRQCSNPKACFVRTKLHQPSVGSGPHPLLNEAAYPWRCR